MNGSVEVLEVIDHILIPEVESLKLINQEGIVNDKLSRQVRLGVEVLVVRLNRLTHSSDVGDSRCRRNGHGVAVAHTVLLHRVTYDLPVESG